MDWDEELSPPQAADELGLHRRTAARWAAQPGRVEGVTTVMDGLHLSYRATRRAWYLAAGRPLTSIPRPEETVDSGVMEAVLAEEKRVWRLDTSLLGRLRLVEVAPAPDQVSAATTTGAIYKTVIRPAVLAKKIATADRPFTTNVPLAPVQVETSERGITRVKARPATGLQFYCDLYPAVYAWGPVAGMSVGWEGALHLTCGRAATPGELWDSLLTSVSQRRWVQQMVRPGVLEGRQVSEHGDLGDVIGLWEDPSAGPEPRRYRIVLRSPEDYREELGRAFINAQRHGYLVLTQPSVAVIEC